MSIEQPIDSQQIEQAKQQIRSLVAEIAQLSKTDVAPEEFYGEFLSRVVSALAAVGGAVWALNPEGRLALQYQINLQETKLRESEEHQAQHSRLLYKVLADGEGVLVPPHSGPGGEGPIDPETPAANPTEFLLVLGLLKTDLETVGLVEIFQRSEAGLTTQKGYLRFLMQMCELAADFLKSHQLRHFSDRQTLWTQLEDFTRAVHASLDPREAAYTIANEGRRLIECDRVSVAIRYGKTCKIEAISGQDLFDKRSNTVRLLGKLATAVVATGDGIWYTGDTRDLPPQVEDAVQEYVDEAHSKTVAVLPLQRPSPLEEDDPKKRIDREPPIGALIVEQIEDSRLTASLTQRADVVCLHSSTALANALEHQNLFLMPVWRALGKTRWVLEARTLPKTLTITGAVLLLLLLLIIRPAQYLVESKGSLEPVIRRDVHARVEGVVEELYVAHEVMVAKDQLLVKLRNIQLDMALTDVQGQRMTTIKQLNSVEVALFGGKISHGEQREQLSGQQAELKQKLNSLNLQLELQQKKKLDLFVRSPINGQVVTWDLRNRLELRPVQVGQVLMRVADPSGPWLLELHMPENRMGSIAEYQQVLFDRLREKLKKMLREETLAKMGEEAAQEDIDQEVETALEQAPDRDLRDRILAIYRQRFDGQIRQILGEAKNESFRSKLGEVLSEKSYEAARDKLKNILPELEEMTQAPTPQPTPEPAPETTSEPAPEPAAEATSASAAENPDKALLPRLEELAGMPDVPDDRLEVSYILATDTGTTHYGKVKEIQSSAEVRGDEGNTVLIKVELNESEMEKMRELQQLRPGATVTAKVNCGPCSLGYKMLHDVWSFVQSRIFFKFF